VTLPFSCLYDFFDAGTGMPAIFTLTAPKWVWSCVIETGAGDFSYG
jgi:hypothetical protein